MFKYDFKLDNVKKMNELFKHKEAIIGEDLGSENDYNVNCDSLIGSIKQIKLKSGIEVYLNQYKVKSDLEFSYSAKNVPFSITKTSIVGGEYTLDTIIKNKIMSEPFQNDEIYLYTNNFQQGKFKVEKGTEIKDINILFNDEFFRNYFEESVEYESIKKYLKDNSKIYHILNRTKLISNYIIQQIFSCNYSGFSKYVYIQSKAMELISIILNEENIIQEEKVKFTDEELKEYNIISNAKSILEDNFQYPPSIEELSKMVGINSFKLKTGFKKYFNNTVYGVVREIKMDRAVQLIKYTKLNIIDIANEVGYSNPSHFSEAFKNIYGLNPSEFRK